MAYLYLFIAIITEVIATTSLKASNGMTKPLPSVLVVVGYLISFYLLSIVMKTIPIAISYALWCGLGLSLIVFSGMYMYQEVPDMPAIIGMGFIMVGIVIIQAFSKMAH